MTNASGVMRGRSSDRSPLSVCVLTAGVVGFPTSTVLEGLVKASLPLTAVSKLAITTEVPGKIFVGGYNSEESRVSTDIQYAISWTRRGTNCTSGSIAPP